MKLAPKSVATFTVLLLGLGVVALWRNSPVALPVAPAEPRFADPLPEATTTALTPTPAQAAEPNPSTVASRPPGQVPPPRAFIYGESGPVTLEDIPSGRFRDQLLVVSDVARARALTALGALRVPISNLASLHVDAEGNLFFACPQSPLAHYDEAAFLPASGPTANSAASNEFTVSVPNSTPPVRHSRPGASRVIYLDFNGHVVTGTSWNSTAGAPSAFFCTPYDTDGNAGSFSPAEQAAIVLIWERVAESFRPFDVDVTTEQPATFNNFTARALITKARDANGVLNPVADTASGVAYLNVFGNSTFAAATSTCFIYQGSMSATKIASVVSHEIGHQMGLSHDGTLPNEPANEYYAGHGADDTSWAPIMGSSSRNVLHWSKGEYLNANNTQDDLALIAAKLSVRPDQVSGTESTASALIFNGSSLRQNGLLETTGDIDTFTFSTSGGPLSLRVSPPEVTALSNRFSVDLAAELRDAAGTLITRSDPPGSASATLEQTLAAGTYFLRITGVGTGSPLNNPPTGYTSYGSIGSYEITGTVPPPTTPSAAAIAQNPEPQNQFPGNPATFSVVARANPAATFSWQRSIDAGATWTSLNENSPYAGTNTADLTVFPLSAPMNGDRFRCVVTNSAGSATSTAATLTIAVPPPPTLPTFDPFPIVSTFGRGLAAGSNTNLTITLTGGSDPLTLRWQRDGVDLPDAAGPVYFLRNWQPTDSGTYRVVATNPAGTVVSPGYRQFVQPEGGWQWRHPTPTGANLTSSAFVNGRFFVGGVRGTVLTSTDGMTWTVRTLPAANNIFGFQYLNGLYIALGSLGAVFTSPDTIAWTPRNSGIIVRDTGTGLIDLTLGNGRIVAVGIGGLTSTSTDAINWTPGTIGVTEDLAGVAFAFGRFHAVSAESGRVFSSSDGVNWTSTMTATSGLGGIAAGAGRLIGVGLSGVTLTSTNGTTWTPGVVFPSANLLGVNFINNQFVAVGTGGAIRTSPDGVTWTARNSSGNASNLQTTAFGNGIYVVPGSASSTARGALLTSTDGVTFRAAIDTATSTSGFNLTLRGIAASPTALVTVGNSGTILQSSDGTRWTNRTSGTSAQLNDIAFGASRFVAVGNTFGGVGTALVSDNGTAWTPVSVPANSLNGVRFAANLWIAVGASGRILSSADGANWTARFLGGTSATLNKTTFGAGLHVVVGNAGTLVTSPDGLAWTATTAPTTANLNDVTFASGTFVAVGAGGAILTSPNGATWSDRSFGNEALTSVTFANGQFLATGPGSNYFVSPDGITWTARFTGASDASFDSAAFGDERYLVGENAAILATSAPLITAPAPQVALVGAPLTLGAAVTASAYPLTYQWTKDGVAIPGATAPTYSLARTAATDAGTYRLIASGPLGSVIASAATVTIDAPTPGRILNLSVRAVAGPDERTLIAGFTLSAGGSKNLLIRGIGPALIPLGVPTALLDPRLQIFNSPPAAPLAANDNWGPNPTLAALFPSVGAFPLDPAGRDAALTSTFLAGNYTANVSTPGTASGVALAEVYDLDAPAAPARLVNLSARAQVGTGADLLIAGFTLSGNVPRTVLIRGIGPGLTQFGVPNILADPKLEVFRDTTLLHANDNWATNTTAAGTAELVAAFARTGAFALPNPASRDAALIVTLAPGNYTAQVSGVNDTTGVALIEIYELP